MKHIIMSLFLIIMISSCNQKGIPVKRAKLKIDSIQFICAKADLIAVLDINTGIDRKKTNEPSKWPSILSGKITRIIKGSENVGDVITFSSTEVNLPPGQTSGSRVIYNGSTLLFLVKQGDGYALLTDHSVMRDENGVAPIWRRDPVPEVRITCIPLESAINDIETELARTKVAEQGGPAPEGTDQ